MSKRDEYIAKMKTQLDEMNAQIDVLAEKSDHAKKDVKEKYAQEMADLRAQSAKARAKLDELKNAGEDRWENLVTEMDKVRDAFKHSYTYFKAQF